METIDDSYTLISLWCRPLARTRYRTSELRRGRIKEGSGGTTTLLRQRREKERAEREASGLLAAERRSPAARDSVYDEYTSALSTTSESYLAVSQRDSKRLETGDEEAPAEVRRPRLRNIRDRISDAVFDYSEIEQEKIEEKIDALVNADGYYNEVDPIDIDEEYQEERHLNKPLIIAIIGLIIYIILIVKF